MNVFVALKCMLDIIFASMGFLSGAVGQLDVLKQFQLVILDAGIMVLVTPGIIRFLPPGFDFVCIDITITLGSLMPLTPLCAIAYRYWLVCW